MNLLFGHDELVAEWVSKNIKLKSFHEPYTAFGIIKDGRLTGGFVFNTYTGDSIEISLAGRGCVSRQGISAVLIYAFNQLGCSRIQMHINRKNKKVRRQAAQLGLRFEGVSRRFYGKDDGLCFSLISDDLPAFCGKWGLKW